MQAAFKRFQENCWRRKHEEGGGPKSKHMGGQEFGLRMEGAVQNTHPDAASSHPSARSAGVTKDAGIPDGS